MIDTRPTPTEASAPTLPDRSVVPAVWSRITNLAVDRGEGSWLVTTDGERYLDYSSGIGVTNTGHAHPRVAAAVAAQAQQAPSRPAEHRLPRARAAPLRAAPARAAGRRLGGVPLEQRGRGGRGGGQAGPGRHGPAGDHRLPRRLPRPDGPDDGPDDRQGRLPRRLRAAPRVRVPHGLPVLLPGGRRRPPARRLHLRLGGPARPDVPPAHLPGPRSGDHRRAGPRARAATSSRRPASCRGCARSPGSTGSCSSPTRSRPASAGPASSSPSSTGTSSRTS